MFVAHEIVRASQHVDHRNPRREQPLGHKPRNPKQPQKCISSCPGTPKPRNQITRNHTGWIVCPDAGATRASGWWCADQKRTQAPCTISQASRLSSGTLHGKAHSMYRLPRSCLFRCTSASPHAASLSNRAHASPVGLPEQCTTKLS
jgi:hypothetical protein